MRLPRRVPWASIDELEQICSWIFADESDTKSKKLAVNRLSAWKAITSLPHALESTLALLTVTLQDDAQSFSSGWSLRQSYATAIVRLVNGLVDPLQRGTYARSIASIAAQLGFPSWLVELRHAATHEDLPRLELLRDGARESMSWLLHNYFLPTLNPSTTPQASQVQLTLPRPLAPILKQYRRIFKIITRDASLQTQYKAEIRSIQREVERWISEAKVAAEVVRVSGGLGWDTGDDSKEKSALEQLCDELMEKGILVPLSKKKRIPSSDSFLPPESSVAVWSPLLTDIHSRHPTFPSVLVHRIIEFLLSESTFSEVQSIDFSELDTTFHMCLARWAFWAIDSWDIDEEDSEKDFKRDVAATMFTALGSGSRDTNRGRNAATALLQAVCAGSEDLEAAREILCSSHGAQLNRNWDHDDVAEMDKRLNALLSVELDGGVVEVERPVLQQPQYVKPASTASIAPEWRLLDHTTAWKPCPIGVYVDGSNQF
jgi:ribosomal biogenesis protein LAS1